VVLIALVQMLTVTIALVFWDTARAAPSEAWAGPAELE
jgi:hypothetical protein